MTSPVIPSSEVLVRVEGVSKKFCRSLKKSLWYGLCDIGAELNPFRSLNAEASINRKGSSVPPNNHSPITNNPPPSALREGEFYAVQDVSFELRRGECLGLIGHNGAGKTTLLKMLNGLIKPDAGRITMRGRVGALIALGAGFNPILTGRENIYINGSVLGLSKREIEGKIGDIIAFAGLEDFIDMPVQNYSSGMQVRLGFAVATALQPDILLLDEVLAVGDMQFYAKCLNTIGRMRRNGTAFILVSHSMFNIARYCDRVAYMKHGRCEYLGDAKGGIACYEKDMALALADQESGSCGQTPAGSGRIAVTEVSLLNAEGGLLMSIQPGEPVVMQINYTKCAEGALPVVIETVVSDKNGELHRFCDGLVTILGADAPARGSFRCCFASVPANSSEISFGFALWSPDFTELYDWKKDIVLPVQAQPLSTGRLHLDVRMAHAGDSREVNS